MQIAARKRGRTLWQGADPEGNTTYEWRSDHEDGTAIEPSRCIHYSKRQADAAWRENNPPAPGGRPPGEKPPKSRRGNPGLFVRLEQDLLEWVETNGGQEYLRRLAREDRDAS